MSAGPTDPRLATAESCERVVVTFSMAPSVAVLPEFAHLQQGVRVADIASGTGVAARRAAPILGASGIVVAIALIAQLLAEAQCHHPKIRLTGE